MAEAILNAENPEVVLPGNNGSAIDFAEVTSPQDDTDFDNMSDEEFDAYLTKAYNGELDEAQTVSPAGTGAEDIADKTQTQPSQSENVPFKAFATEEEYNADRQRFFDEHIGNRLKGAREDSELLGRIRGLANTYYGNDDNALDMLLEDLESQNAQAAGMDKAQYVERENDRRDAQAYREQMRRQEDAERSRNELISRWRSEETRLKTVVPEFDLNTALKNPDFHGMLVNGFSVDGAYYAIKNREMQGQQNTSGRRFIQQNGQTRGTKPGSSVNDAMNMSDKDFDSYIRGIMNK